MVRKKESRSKSIRNKPSVEIRIFRRDEHIEGFRISGHAGLEEAGKDICCAALSAISQTALLGLVGQMEVKPDYEYRDGWLEVSLKSDLGGEDRNKADVILKTMEAGLNWVADEYPEIVAFVKE